MSNKLLTTESAPRDPARDGDEPPAMRKALNGSIQFIHGIRQWLAILLAQKPRDGTYT
jgi:hypothetical protein